MEKLKNIYATLVTITSPVFWVVMLTQITVEALKILGRKFKNLFKKSGKR